MSTDRNTADWDLEEEYRNGMNLARANMPRLCQQIGRLLETRKKELVTVLSEAMRSDLAGGVPHFVLERSFAPWDPAGDLFPLGWFNPGKATVGDFLNEYTGTWLLQYEPGPGRCWVTYRDRYGRVIEDWVEEICSEAVAAFFTGFSPDAEGDLVQDVCDEIRIAPEAAAFFDLEHMFERLGLTPDRKLLEFLQSCSENCAAVQGICGENSAGEGDYGRSPSF